ncbi:unnamed protein product [Leptosia nina]|uniref:Slowpoke binding protein n=1 Tax=Leptosia nina TaxID=320188 RepID=A0AAV1K326_9NEOP
MLINRNKIKRKSGQCLSGAQRQWLKSNGNSAVNIIVRMFNLYQHMKANNEGKEQKEPETTGHDRFYQERHRSSYRKKKRRCRRAQSAAELNPESLAAANAKDKRNAFRVRSVSTDKEDSEEENSDRAPLVAQKIDSLAKLLFNKSIMGSGSDKNSPSEASPKYPECTIESGVAIAICSEYLSRTPRYTLLKALNQVGYRPNKHWFAIQDNTIKTERLLTVMPLTNKCPIEPTERTQCLIMELFRALHHPYIYPVLDLELCNGHALVVMPFNSTGSLKDLIYKSTWSDEYTKKYTSVGCGLPASQVARFGRQILEALLFLKDKGFPPYRHLHSGNVMIQNGVARLCGLENKLIGAKGRSPNTDVPLDHVETLSLGHLLFEMCAATDTDFLLLPELQPSYPQVVEIIGLIFGQRTPSLHELLISELFRKIDLREMKGSCLPNFSQRLSQSCLSLLNEVNRHATPPTLDYPPQSFGDQSPRSFEDQASYADYARFRDTSPVRGDYSPPRRIGSPDSPPRRMLAICVVQPMDLIKTRMQLAGPKGSSIGEVVGGIMQKEGVFGFYSGLSAALFRQATYTTGRLGCFNAVFDYYQSNIGTPNFAAKIGLGSFAGGVGAIVGNPAEVALIRMTADGRLPPEQRRNYRHVIDALARICREEGAGTLMRGVTATVTRAMVVNGAQLSTYQQTREMLLAYMPDGIPLHATCAMIAGLVTSAASLPVDIVKTRQNDIFFRVSSSEVHETSTTVLITHLSQQNFLTDHGTVKKVERRITCRVQNSTKGAGQVAVLMNVIKNEGVLALWSGFLPTYAKIGPHTIITFIILEQMKAFYFKL